MCICIFTHCWKRSCASWLLRLPLLSILALFSSWFDYLFLIFRSDFRTWNFVRTLRRINSFENQNKQISDSKRAHNIFPRIAKNLLLAHNPSYHLPENAEEVLIILQRKFGKMRILRWKACFSIYKILSIENQLSGKCEWPLWCEWIARVRSHSICLHWLRRVSSITTQIHNMHIETKIITNFRWINNNNNINWQFSVAAMAVAATVAWSATDWP